MTFSFVPMLAILGSAAFLGSWHCSAMCGPIVVAISRRGSVWTYHLGRGVSYLLLGAAAGAGGAQIWSGAISHFRWIGASLLTIFFLTHLYSFIKPGLLAKLYVSLQPARRGPFVLGLLSGLLPCGWLWTFVASAAASGSAWAGALVTGTLWLTSLPALALLTVYFKRSTRRIPSLQLRLVNGVLTAAGIYSVWAHFF